MRIAILRLNVGEFGKIGFYNVQEIGLASVLRKMGHKTYVCYLDKSISEIKEINEKDIIYFPCKHLGVHGIMDVSYLKKYKLDSLILFADNQLWQKNIIKWCRKNGVKCVCYFGRIDTQSTNLINRVFYKYLLIRNYNQIKRSINITKTVATKNTMKKLGLPVQEVIPVGLDMEMLNTELLCKEKLRDLLNLPKEKKILLFVGRLEANKRPLFALDILSKLTNKQEDYYLIIIGKGSLQESLVKSINEKNLLSKVRYIESIPNNEIYKYYSASDCLINLCNVEIFGMTILESMYYKCPVVAMRADGPCDIITNEVTGMICDTYNLEEWKEKIEIAINNENIIRNAYQLIIDRFNWNVCARKFVKYLSKT